MQNPATSSSLADSKQSDEDKVQSALPEYERRQREVLLQFQRMRKDLAAAHLREEQANQQLELLKLQSTQEVEGLKQKVGEMDLNACCQSQRQG